MQVIRVFLGILYFKNEDNVYYIGQFLIGHWDSDW